MGLPILCLDFDGVIHAYSKGWQDGSIYDEVVPGFWDFAKRAAQEFRLVVYSSRSRDPRGVADMRYWLWQQYKAAHKDAMDVADMPAFEFASQKPAAFVTLDDRAITFTGTWPDVKTLRDFKPWNMRD